MWATPFCLIDPAIAFRCLIPFFLRSLELFRARFRSLLFVSRAAMHRRKGDRNDHTKEDKKHDSPHPGGKQEARLLGMGEYIVVVRHG